MDHFKEISLPLVLIFEGSQYTFHPADRGGPTRYGVIQREYDRYCASKGFALQSVEDITLTEVQDIYYSKYWVPARCQSMQGKLATVVFDTSVNSGQGRAVKILQQAIGAKVDGVIGDETLSKAVSIDDHKAASAFINYREAFYHAIVDHDPTQSVFLNGWLRRARYLRAYIDGAKTLEQIRNEW